MEKKLYLMYPQVKGVIAPEIYGHFTEHIGGVFYDGLWVGRDSSVPNIKGFRKDVIEKMLRGLKKNCDFALEEQSILQNCSESYHKEEGRHIPIVYGDYYLMEALLKLRKKNMIRIF